MRKAQLNAATLRLAEEFGYPDLNMIRGTGPLIYSMPGETIGQQFEKIVVLALGGAVIASAKRPAKRFKKSRI